MTDEQAFMIVACIAEELGFESEDPYFIEELGTDSENLVFYAILTKQSILAAWTEINSIINDLTQKKRQ